MPYLRIAYYWTPLYLFLLVFITVILKAGAYGGVFSFYAQSHYVI